MTRIFATPQFLKKDDLDLIRGLRIERLTGIERQRPAHGITATLKLILNRTCSVITSAGT